jgi:MoaA/NifB/PqqE/SkfB family radical SAM enzyme
MDKGINMPKEPLLKRSTAPNKVFFTWELTYECNYNCTYCHAPKHSKPGIPPTVFPGLAKWKEVWDRMYENYGECVLAISGGEPFIYPDIIELAEYISQKHIMEFTTNLHFDVKEVVNKFSNKRVRFATSFHPNSADLDDFIKKILLLKEHGFEANVNFVPWPPFLSKYPEYKKAFDSNNVRLIMQPFIGSYENKNYPKAYSKEEKQLLSITDDEGSRKAVEFKTTNESNKKGKLCRMGQNYAFIHPDGSTDRCCKDKTVKLGNVIDGTFKLLDEPKPCCSDECNCWRCMLVEKEPDWIKHWLRNG